jgi:hypothetical protein
LVRRLKKMQMDVSSRVSVHVHALRACDVYSKSIPSCCLRWRSAEQLREWDSNHVKTVRRVPILAVEHITMEVCHPRGLYAP